jgi:hypothetical protein
MIFCDLIPLLTIQIFNGLKTIEVGSVNWTSGFGSVFQGYGSAVRTRKKYCRIHNTDGFYVMLWIGIQKDLSLFTLLVSDR